MRKATKNIISFAVILIAGLNFIVPAFAQDPFTGIAIGGIGGASGAGLFGSMASMSGINIGWSSSGSDTMDAMWNTLNPDHVYFSGEKHEASGVGEDVWDYITVDLGDWLDAQSDFIVNFAQTNNVTDNSSGTVTENYFSYSGYPFNTSLGNNTYRGGNVGTVGQGSFTLGGYSVVLTETTSTSFKYTTYYGGAQVGSVRSLNLSLQGTPTYYIYNSTTSNLTLVYSDAQYGNRYDVGRGASINPGQPTSINWTSGNVNTNVFNGWEDARVKIPHSISGLSTGWTIPDFTNAINDIWSRNLQGQIVIEDTDQPVPPPPTPTPTPLPTTPISDVPFDEFVDLWGTTITNNQTDANQKLDFIGSNGEDQLEELEDINTAIFDLNDTANHIDAGVTYILQDTDSIDTNVGSIEGYTENIDTNIDSLVGTADNIDTNITSIESLTGSIDNNVDDIADTADSIDTNIGIGNGILGGIRNLAESAVDKLDSILENIEELVESVVQATETLIAGILNQIPQAFGVIFSPIKQASSIWHYVVEWITSIGAPFGFIWSMASGTSYYIILPVYASLAAAVVLAFFKRFGR